VKAIYQVRFVVEFYQAYRTIVVLHRFQDKILKGICFYRDIYNSTCFNNLIGNLIFVFTVKAGHSWVGGLSNCRWPWYNFENTWEVGCMDAVLNLHHL
jgi:hypothetical protein